MEIRPLQTFGFLFKYVLHILRDIRNEMQSRELAI